MLHNISRSLEDMLGKPYMDAVQETAVTLLGLTPDEAKALATDKVEFWPDAFAAHADAMAAKVGQQVATPFETELVGAPTESFRKATHVHASPIGGVGTVRVGQDGRAYIAAKSEHYHIPLGHNFPGYKLITKARQLGILNATHNNTRGYITRKMEEQIIMDANGITERGDQLTAVLQSKESKVLNRLINLETGSLAVEAAIKMMLTRFYRLDKTFDAPKHAGKTPVFLVMQDNDGGPEANYHGTTIFAQSFRGMWPDFAAACEEKGLYKVVPVKYNDLADFEAKIKQYNEGNYKTAGFMHEIILMNYGGIRLTKEFLQGAYALAAQYDTPTLSDEIQSCMWYKGMFLFKEYGLKPDFVIIGKGFPGGEYPASKVITTYEMDSLNQFGALVTNGQEELAALAYLLTMEFVRENGDEIAAMGALIDSKLAVLAAKHPDKIEKIDGKAHMDAIHFQTVDAAAQFGKLVNGMCIDVSAQLYKANCPPAVLLKLPLVTSEAVLNVILEKFESALVQM